MACPDPGVQRSRVEVFANLVALCGVLVVNVLANAVPLGGQTTGAVSAKYPSLFTPAGYVFSIWGLIYLLLIAFAVWQALPGQRHDSCLHRLRVPFLLSCGANGAWIFAWHYDQVILSFILMLVLLGSLVTIYRRLPPAPMRAAPVRFVCLALPFRVYTAWIAVASLANLSALQVHFGLQDWGVGELAQTLVKLGLLSLVALVLLVRRKDMVFLLVLAWAALGIAVKNELVTLASRGGHQTVFQPTNVLPDHATRT